MNLNDISTQIIFTTVPIWVEKESGTESGTGFFFLKQVDENITVPFIVTNYHVVKGAKRGLISLIKKEGDSPLLTEKVTVELHNDLLTKYIDIENDLAIFPIGPILNQLGEQNINIFYRSIDESIIPNKNTLNDLSAIEEITFIGYPSGLYDQKNNTPIVRRGITASPVWNNFNGENKFLIDAGVYPGSSGSPVLILNSGSYSTKDGITVGNRVLFLGIISQTIKRTEKDLQVYLGLGEVINSSKIKDLVDKVCKTIKY